MTRHQWTLLACLVLLLPISLIEAPYPRQMYLQHIPTVAVLLSWPFLAKRFPLTNAAATCLAAFLLLHIVAARYIYSFVPYDRWAEALFGFTITERFGFSRNHFDRLVHFSFGALWVRPVWEICVRYFHVPRRFAYYIAFEFVLAFSMVYELFEWGLSIVLAGDDADAYNGQQGDMWDAQKDMALAMLGALLSLVVLVVTRRRRTAVVPALLLLPLLVGCGPTFLHVKYTCMDGAVPSGRYEWRDYAFGYWGYKVGLTVDGRHGIARISDARSAFDVADTLTYRRSGYNDCDDIFGGRYLSFVRRDDEWIIELVNPVSGYEFIGVTSLSPREE